MIGDSFLFNLAVFLLGQATAWGYLRTGLVARGVALMIGGWLLADAALVARFAFGHTGTAYVACLAAMQLYSLVEFALFVYRRARRRSTERARLREREFARAFRHYLRNELEQALAAYRALLGADPWDVEARLGYATVLARSGRVRKARASFRAARCLDRVDAWADVIEVELLRLRAASPRRPSKPARRAATPEAAAD